MSDDQDQLLDGITALVPPLLTAIEMLQPAGRHFHPPHLPELASQLEAYYQPLQDGWAVFQAVEWPDNLKGMAQGTEKSASLAVRSLQEFLSAQNQSNPTMAAYRALGYATKATEALYPLAQIFPPVSRFFLDPPYRNDEALIQKVLHADASRPDVGVMHADNASDQRGGFSMYVPEYYAGEKVPLILALHGGSGHGRSFLWSWLRTARSRNAIVISPTSKDGTWSLMGPDVDSANLDAMVAYAAEHWNVDDQRILLTGMSDGGTFSYVSGLRAEVPYTHLAPCSASFHPMLVQAVDPARLRHLPIYLIHGALDWMFPVDVARDARTALTEAGAMVTYREIEDLSHTYPQDENDRIIDWLLA